MTITNPATRQLRVTGSPIGAADVCINDAIVRFVEKHGPSTQAQIEEVFLPAPADGCNANDIRALKQRLTYLVATGRLLRTSGGVGWLTRAEKFHATSTSSNTATNH